MLPVTPGDVEHLPADLLLNGEVPVSLEDTVTHIFVPMSPRVFLIADHADIVARHFLRDYGARLAGAALAKLEPSDTEGTDAVARFIKALEDGQIIRRTYLTTAGRYRHHLAKGDLAEAAKVEAITRTLPHFIWVTELLYRDADQTRDGGAREIVGHIVINATSSTDQNSDLLFAHLPRIVIHRNVDPPEGSQQAYEESATLVDGPVGYAQRLRI